MDPFTLNKTKNLLTSTDLTPTIYTVSELNFAAQKILEGQFQKICVEGEISNLARPASGHLYFTLKDAKAQIRAAMFRQYSQKHSNLELRNGLLVQVKARVSIYPDRGDYQLIVESIELAGEGLLRQAYEKLLKKLSEEGLFQEIHKKPLPSIPKHIAVITSPTGAAIRDILSVLKRRFPSVPITIIPTKVQGQDAAPEIIRAIYLANQLNQEIEIKAEAFDVIILARGGGSLEDLWPFNEESVARAIFASQIPIISGVGHETDFTIADFVADRRAPTPSAAAELVSPNAQEWQRQFFLIEQDIKNRMIKIIQFFYQRLDYLTKRMRHPGQQLAQQSERLTGLSNRLLFTMQSLIKEKQNLYGALMRALNTVSPLATLTRGYAIATHAGNDKKDQVIYSVSEVSQGDKVRIRVADGDFLCDVQ